MRQLRALAVTPRLLRPFSRPASVKNTPSRGTPLALPPCLQILQAKAAEKPQQTRARSATPADQQDALNPVEASTPPLAHPSLEQRASPQPSDLIRPLNEASPTPEVVAPPPSSPATAISDEAEQVSSTTEIWRILQSPLITEIVEPASSPPIVEPSLWPPISPPRTEPQALPLSSSSAKEAVAESFEDVPRELVLAYDGHSIHKNVGEVLPAGISILLSELGGIDDRDIFVDIGSGLGNVEALVVLSTNIYRAVGIEAQEQVQTAGIQAINKSLYARAFRDRAPFICKYIRDIRLSSTSPFAEATIVYWNNVVFEPSVTEHVKQQLQDMADIRIQLSCVNFYRRHRVLCFNHFCASFSFKKVVEVPCSWKSDLLAVYIYNSTYNE